jgi:DNA ligase-1
LCNSKEEILENHKINTQNNYEGSIIRNSRGMYKCKFRSFDLLKYKDFDDAEFEIVNYTYEKDVTGNDKNLIVWVCKTSENKEFHVQSKGTREERHELYKNASKYIGKKLWVQYFGLTNDLIPRFPKTLREGKLSIREEIS